MGIKVDRVYCGELLDDGNRCRGVHSATYDPNGDVIVITCTNKSCKFYERVKDRRKENRK